MRPRTPHTGVCPMRNWARLDPEQGSAQIERNAGTEIGELVDAVARDLDVNFLQHDWTRLSRFAEADGRILADPALCALKNATQKQGGERRCRS